MNGVDAEQWPNQAAQAVIDSIDGDRIHDRILELAALNGTLLEPTDGHPAPHYATNRLALSLEDIVARKTVVEPWMEQAGMEVEYHPLAVIGRLSGTTDEKPLVLLSHVDTVPQGDMYDGTYGVISAIEVVEAMKKSGYEPTTDIIVLALTGEESAAFNFALFGSRALFHGLTETELRAKEKGQSGQELRQVLGPQTAGRVRQPFFGTNTKYPLPGLALELHVEQAPILEEHYTEVGLVQAIAAPERYRAVIGGHALEPDTREYAYEAIFALNANGRAGHSGTTPMASSERADGLLATAELLTELTADGSFNEEFFSIGDIEIEGGGSINQIPGHTTTMLRIMSDDPEEYQSHMDSLGEAIDQFNNAYEFVRTGFSGLPFSIERIRLNDEQKPRFFGGAIIKRQLAAFDMTQRVNSTALELEDQGVVGTVGIYSTTAEGFIELAIDIRGTDSAARSSAVSNLQRLADNTWSNIRLGEPLAGSGEPVTMDSRTLSLASTALRATGISHEVMTCKAGHDIQNVVRAGIPGLLMLVQSNNRGLAHNPDAYTAKEHLLAGARGLAAVVTRLDSDR